MASSIASFGADNASFLSLTASCRSLPAPQAGGERLYSFASAYASEIDPVDTSGSHPPAYHHDVAHPRVQFTSPAWNDYDSSYGGSDAGSEAGDDPNGAVDKLSEMPMSPTHFAEVMKVCASCMHVESKELQLREIQGLALATANPAGNIKSQKEAGVHVRPAIGDRKEQGEKHQRFFEKYFTVVDGGDGTPNSGKTWSYGGSKDRRRLPTGSASSRITFSYTPVTLTSTVHEVGHVSEDARSGDIRNSTLCKENDQKSATVDAPEIIGDVDWDKGKTPGDLVIAWKRNEIAKFWLDTHLIVKEAGNSDGTGRRWSCKPSGDRLDYEPSSSENRRCSSFGTEVYARCLGNTCNSTHQFTEHHGRRGAIGPCPGSSGHCNRERV